MVIGVMWPFDLIADAVDLNCPFVDMAMENRAGEANS